MLPGFNHNIRYKDRVFHVQTEDTGLSQPFLVTQVFIGGHLVAIEKTSYADVLKGQFDHDKRNEQIRSRMQDQHKRLLKNLVKHAYDDKIALYLVAPANAKSSPEVLRAISAAESMPRADTNPQLVVKSASNEEAATLPIADEIPDKRHSPVSGVHETMSPLAPAPEEMRSEADVFQVFDEELKKQANWSPSNKVGALPTLDPSLFDTGDLETTPPEAKGGKTDAVNANTRKPLTPDRTTPDRTLQRNVTIPRDRRPRPPPEAATEVSRKPPPISDTLIDFGLPAALKEQLGQAKAALEQARKKGQEIGPPTSRKSDPRVARFRMPRSPSPSPKIREQETQIDLALRRRASSGRNTRPPEKGDSNADTMLDVNAGEIQEYIARKRREQEAASAESWGDAVDTVPGIAVVEEDSKRPNILVVERSLDEVILSYLADED